MSDADTSSWSWDRRMGKTHLDHLSEEDTVYLQYLREDMELARLAFVEAKSEFDRACDAVYCFVRSKWESE